MSCATSEVSFRAEVKERLRRARSAGHAMAEAFCQSELDGHHATWRSVEVVAWGEYPDERPAPPHVPRDPRGLSPEAFEELARSMRRAVWIVDWSLAELEAQIEQHDDNDIVACEQSSHLYYRRGALRGLLEKIRTVLDAVTPRES